MRRGMILAFLCWPALAAAQTDFSTRNPVGLFQDLQADTVTSNLFHHFAPTPHIAFHVTRPVPGRDLLGATNALAAIDFDNDGILDVVKADASFPGEPPALLLLGNGDGTFRIHPDSGLPGRVGRVQAADLDNDGWTDLVLSELEGGYREQTWDSPVVQEPTGPWLRILRNAQGRRFVDVTAPWLGSRRIRDGSWALADFDQDGWLDVALGALTTENRRQVHVFYGQGDGFIAREHSEISFPWPDPTPLPHDLSFPGLSVYDVDDDGDQDLLLQEISHWARRERALAVMTNAGGRLLPPAPFSLSQTGRYCLSWADVDNDGRFDVFAGVSDWQGGRNQLLMNQGEGRFEDRGRHMGLWAGYNHTLGVVWADWDNDGFLDLCQCRIFNEGADTEAALFLNEGGRRFLNITGRADARLSPGSAAALALDADQDGDPDLLVSHQIIYLDRMPLERTALQLLINRSRAGRWLDVELEGTVSNRSALGARVTVWAEGRPLYRSVAGGATPRIWPALRLHFGLGAAARADSVVVRWPSGVRERWGGCAADAFLRLSEGAGASRW